MKERNGTDINIINKNEFWRRGGTLDQSFDKFIIWLGGTPEDKYDMGIDMWTEWWCGEVWEAFEPFIRGEITFMEAFLAHYKCMFAVYFFFFQLLAMIATAFVTIGERSIIADYQGRKGPRKTGFNGFLQPIADACKLLSKEKISVRFIQEKSFTIATWAAFFVSLILWLLLPLGLETFLLNLDFTSFFLINIAILHIFAIMFASWSSGSKYSFLGGFRTAAQMLSFELCIGIAINILYKYSKNLNILIIDYFGTEVGAFVFYLVGAAIIFFIASLAELNRHPFDLPEAEAELVAGYNVEYTGIRFALFFLAEYLSIIFYSVLFNKLYIGESFYFTANVLTVSAIVFIIIALRTLIPRYRYDQLMRINWKCFIPILVIIILFLVLLEYLLM